MKKNNAWNIRLMSRLSHRPSDPAYYIEDRRILGHAQILQQAHNLAPCQILMVFRLLVLFSINPIEQVQNIINGEFQKR